MKACVRSRSRCCISMLAAWGCVDADSVSFGPTQALVFVARVSSTSGELIEAEGPLLMTNPPLVLREGEALLRIEIDDAALADRFHGYETDVRPYLALVDAPEDADVCGVDGRVNEDDSLELRLDEANFGENTISVQRISGSPAIAEPVPTPSGLALRLPASTCGGRAEFHFRPFASEASAQLAALHERLYSFPTIIALDPQHLVIAAETGLIFVTRDSAEVSTFELEPLVRAQAQDRRWSISHAATIPNPILSSAKLVVASLSAREILADQRNSETRGGWLRLSLSSTGAWSLLDVTLLEPEGDNDRNGMRYVHAEASGRYVLAGRERVWTATAADARPVAGPKAEGVFPRLIEPLDEPEPPHLMLMDGSLMVEGDLFSPDWQNSIYAIGDSADLRFAGIARLTGGSKARVATGSDQVLWLRAGPGVWRTLNYSLPASAGTCLGVPSVCGWRGFINRMGPIANAPNGEGFLFAAKSCSGIFWKQPGEVCVAGAAVPGEEIGTRSLATIDAMTTLGTETFVATADGQLLILEVGRE